MTDLAGIRIINYIEADVKKTSDVIEQSFKIHKDLTENKRDSLGHDKIGYQSIHYICELGEQRENLPEYSKYRGKLFEVQIRTILQHAWAEIEHDRNYKFTGILPRDIQRRFNLIAGQLEIADREFNSIAREIDMYKSNVIEKTGHDDFNIEVDATSLLEFIKKQAGRFKAAEVTLSENVDIKSINILVEEVKDFGITRLSQLADLLTSEFVEKYDRFIKNTNEGGFIRDILLFANIDKYFKKSWKHHWNGTDSDSVNLIIDKYGREKLDSIESMFSENIFFTHPDL